jgi:hypothetical protein
MFSVHSKYKYSEKYLIGAFIGGICIDYRLNMKLFKG